MTVVMAVQQFIPKTIESNKLSDVWILSLRAISKKRKERKKTEVATLIYNKIDIRRENN